MNASSQTHAQKTSAADKSIGFEFQFYYFLYRLLMIEEGESVAMEVEDDVSCQLKNERLVLIQLKHTIQKTAAGGSSALTTLDSDLWKTISNWSKNICDENAGRKNKNEQLAFVEKTDFVLVTNKADNNKNEILKEIKRFQDKKITFSQLRYTFTILLIDPAR